jgi:crotonobetainyl-CoA:carnitine CoA-transferase CaiB-like acyl-CoA transferase
MAQFPRLIPIVCDISGYGLNGPCRQESLRSFDSKRSRGFLSVTGTPETPSKSGNSIADIPAGMYAYSNILSALLDQRDKTGRGSHIDVAMLESLTERMDGISDVLRHRRCAATAVEVLRPMQPFTHYGPFEVGAIPTHTHKT